MRANIAVFGREGRRYGMPSMLLHGPARARGWEFGHSIQPPIVRSNTYRLESTQRGHEAFLSFATPGAELSGESPLLIYERLASPNKTTLQDELVLLENGQAARVFATGMGAENAALFTVLDARRNHRILADTMLYGCTFSLFNRGMARRGIAVDFIDTSNLSAVVAAITPQTRVIYFESPANPALKLTDMMGLKKIVDDINVNREPEDQITLIMDSTFATPYSQRPLDLGMDMVVHSMTKNLNGFGTRMGGVVIINDVERFLTDLELELKDGGAVMLDEVAWDFLTYGLATFMMRIPIKTENAGIVARFLEDHPKVGQGNIVYPGLESFPQYELAKRQMSTGVTGKFAPGDMIYFQLAQKGGESREAYLGRTAAFLDYIADTSYVMTLGVSLGLLKTMIECPAVMTHSSYTEEQLIKAGLLPGGIRMALGTEAAEDIVADVEEALDKAA